MKSAFLWFGTIENLLENGDRCAGWRSWIIESAGELELAHWMHAKTAGIFDESNDFGTRGANWGVTTTSLNRRAVPRPPRASGFLFVVA
jgi:hypothetical protein